VWSLSLLGLTACQSTEPMAPPAPPPDSPVLLFASGFENDVVIEPEYRAGGQWWQEITGTDRSTGFTWPDDLPAPPIGFQPLVAADTPDPSAYTFNRIILAPGPRGDLSRVLHQEVTRDDPDLGTVRSNYLLDPKDVEEAYTRCWVYLQPDLLEVMSAGDVPYKWRQLWEMKCAPDALTPDGFGWSYRYNVTLVYRASQGLFFRAQSEVRGLNITDWVYENDAIPVPRGEWFLFEVYFRQSASDGRFVVKIDGTTLCDHHGRTMVTERGNKWNLVKCYTDTQHLEQNGRSAWQRVDDLEVWSTMPGE